MTYVITIRDATSSHTYHAIGNVCDLMDAAYDQGALGVTVVVQS